MEGWRGCGGSGGCAMTTEMSGMYASKGNADTIVGEYNQDMSLLHWHDQP